MDSNEAQLIAQINTAIQKIESAVNALRDALNAILSAVPFFMGWIVDVIKQGFAWFIKQMESFWNMVNGLLAKMGSPGAVSDAGNAWSDRVGGPVSAEVGNIGASMLLVDDRWVGEASNRYKEIIPDQKLAIEKIKSVFTDGIALVMSQFRTAIVFFWGAMIVALVTLAVGIIGALGFFFGVITAPAAIPAAIAAVALCIASIGVGAANLVSAAASANTQLRQKLNDNVAYPGNKWPRAVLQG